MELARIVIYRKPFGGPGGMRVKKVTVNGVEIPTAFGVKITDYVSDMPRVALEMWGTVFYEDEEAE